MISTSPVPWKEVILLAIGTCLLAGMLLIAQVPFYGQ